PILTRKVREHLSHISYFLTGNTAQGHMSLIQQALDRVNKLVSIEGPYLSDNCNVMEQLRKALLQQCEEMEFVHHPSAPNALQGIVFPKSKLAIFSFTPEHRIPLEDFNGELLTLNLYDYYNIEQLKMKQAEIDALTSSII